mmetsp:Transcript_24541/g.75968  ORF Transcript_24541/g.75968 Transcript_24541/m.75968 type:complete len:250 (+) Transcript_24541:303-1052(+)
MNVARCDRTSKRLHKAGRRTPRQVVPVPAAAHATALRQRQPIGCEQTNDIPAQACHGVAARATESLASRQPVCSLLLLGRHQRMRVSPVCTLISVAGARPATPFVEVRRYAQVQLPQTVCFKKFSGMTLRSCHHHDSSIKLAVDSSSVRAMGLAPRYVSPQRSSMGLYDSATSQRPPLNVLPFAAASSWTRAVLGAMTVCGDASSTQWKRLPSKVQLAKVARQRCISISPRVLPATRQSARAAVPFPLR